MPKECAVCKKQAVVYANVSKGAQTVSVYLCENCAKKIGEKTKVEIVGSGIPSLEKGQVIGPRHIEQEKNVKAVSGISQQKAKSIKTVSIKTYIVSMLLVFLVVSSVFIAYMVKNKALNESKQKNITDEIPASQKINCDNQEDKEINPDNIINSIIDGCNLLNKTTRNKYLEIKEIMGGSYLDYKNNYHLLTDLYSEIGESYRGLYSAISNYTADYYKYVLNKYGNDNNRLDRSFENLREYIYSGALDGIYEYVYSGVFDEIYEDFDDIILEEAYDKTPYDEWKEESERLFDDWNEYSSNFNEEWKKFINEYYIIWNVMSNSVYSGDRDYEMLMKKAKIEIQNYFENNDMSIEDISEYNVSDEIMDYNRETIGRVQEKAEEIQNVISEAIPDSMNGEKTITNCTVSISTPDALVVECQISLEGKEDHPPTVLDAVKFVLDFMKQEEGNEQLDYSLELDTNDNPVRFNFITDKDGNIYKYGVLDDEATLYGLWDFTIDDIESEVGMSSAPIHEGQTIKFFYTTHTAEDLMDHN